MSDGQMESQQSPARLREGGVARTPEGLVRALRAGRAPWTRHARISHHNHMKIHWHKFVDAGEELAVNASMADKSSIICRAGLLMLSGGTGGWRVRETMNRIARVLGVTCAVDLSLTTIECTCFDENDSFSEVLALPSAGVNTERIWYMEKFLTQVETLGREFTVHEFHELLDVIEHKKGNYAPWQVGLASAAACGAFVFLLGGGPIEMGCAFIGAGLGNYVRRLMIDRHMTLFACVGISVAIACLAYLGSLGLLSLVYPPAMGHEGGYIGAMLFVIPGFPLITSGLDIAQLDMRSGMERGMHAISVIVVATMVGWLVASPTPLHPDDFLPLGLTPPVLTLLRMAMSFVGVFGFSVMFNSPAKMCAVAGVGGVVANTLRLSLVDFAHMPPEAAAFVGALTAGLIATLMGLKFGYPRISITVPSIVIMVPGLYMYRAVYYMGMFQTVDAMEWVIRAAMIVLFLPLGLAAARILTDANWRHVS